MKLPWDKKYSKISFYIILTIALIYVVVTMLDLVFTGLFNIDLVVGGIANFFGTLGMVFKPLIIAFVIAYIMDPVADKFQSMYDNYQSKHGDHEKQTKIMVKEFKREQSQIEDSLDGKSGFIYRPRSQGALLTFITIFAVIILAFTLVIGSVTKKSEEVVSNVTSQEEIQEELEIENIEDTTFIEDITITVYSIFDEYMDDFESMENTINKLGLSETFDEYLAKFGDFMAGFSKMVINLIISIGSGIATAFIALVLAFYMIRDKEKFKNNTIIFIDSFTPQRMAKALKNFGSDLHAIFSGYLRGQITDALIIGFLLGSSLSVIGIPFAWFIGIFSGFSNLIPYVGAIVGFILAVSSGLLSGQPILALYAAIIILIIQQLDTIYISPRFVGQSVELSPFLVILSLSVAGSIFGLVGMVLAVPVTAMAKILIVRFVARNNGNFIFSKLYEKIQSIGNEE